MTEIETTVRRVLDDTLRGLGNSPVEVDSDANLLETGVLDSFGFLDFIGSLEDAFGTYIEITELDEDRMVTIGGMSSEVARLLGR